ncbi:MAG: winged helix-turn-helix domain-containing protein [Bacilli bacterium]
MAERQATFDDLAAVQYVRSLNATQINIIRLLEQGQYQAQVARRLNKSRSYVCQVVKKLESSGLLIARRIAFTHKGKTHTVATNDPLQNRATGYIVTPRLQDLLAQNPNKDGSYTLSIPHHIKIKIPILDQNQPVVTAGWRQSRARSILVRSWKPRGPERHLFHVQTVGGRIGVEYHGSSLVAYRVERTHLLAADVGEATTLAAAQIQDGVARFVEEQGWFGVRLTLGTPTIIDKPHFAFASKAARKVLDAGHQLTTPGIYCDNSLAHHGRPDVGEIETTDPILADQIDRGLRNALHLEPLVEQSVARGMVEQSKTILDGFCQQLDPIQQTLGSIYETANTVLAHVQGGTTLEYQFTQIVTLLTHTLNEMKDLRARVADLEEGHQSTKPPRGKKNVARTMQSPDPGAVIPPSGRADHRTPAGRQPQSLPEVRAGLPKTPGPEVPLPPAGPAPGGDPVCLPGVLRPDAGGGTPAGRRARTKKKK